MEGPETRQSLLLRLKDATQQEAWQEFVDIYEPLVYRLARKRGLQHADAMDISQEVFSADGPGDPSYVGTPIQARRASE